MTSIQSNIECSTIKCVSFHYLYGHLLIEFPEFKIAHETRCVNMAVNVTLKKSFVIATGNG